MGTRSTTTVYDGEVPILSFYGQYDGYPDGLGETLAKFLTGKTVVNGIPAGASKAEQASIVNGPGDLAIRLLVFVKNEHGGVDKPGGFYAVNHEHTGDEDYHYDVIVVGAEGFGATKQPGSIHVRVKSFGTLIAEGGPEDFVANAMAAESADA